MSTTRFAYVRGRWRWQEADPCPARCTGRTHPRPTTCHCPSAARLGRAGDGNACNACRRGPKDSSRY